MIKENCDSIYNTINLCNGSKLNSILQING